MRRVLPWFQFALKYILAPAIAVAVAVHFYQLLKAYPPRSDAFQLRYEFLFASAGCYIFAHTVWGTFFWQLLRDQGTAVTWFAALRAYFVSQVGKYLPGKAWVILLRVMMLKGNGVSRAAVGVCGVFETLTSMAAGAMLAALLFPYTGLIQAGGMETETYKRLAVVGVAMLPIGAWLLNRLIVRITRKVKGPDAKPFPKPSLLRLLQGLVQAMLGWFALGIGVVFAMFGLYPEPMIMNTDSLFGVFGANAVAYISGFVLLFLPGGLGAREELLQRMLQAQLAPRLGDDALPLAVMTAIVLRTLWTVAELIIGSLLWWLGRTRDAKAGAEASQSTETVNA